MDAPRSHTRRTATSWALIGTGAAGIVGAGALTCAEAVSAPAVEPAAYPGQLTPALNGPSGKTTTSSSVGPSYSPGHTRSRGS